MAVFNLFTGTITSLLLVTSMQPVQATEASHFNNTQTGSSTLIAQAPERCPSGGGGGSVVGYYQTRSFNIYICQGGTGRTDWRELDYFGVSRTRPNQTLRLRAYLNNPSGFYAVNGTYRYTIDRTSLSVSNNGRTILREVVTNCVGNDAACGS